MTLSLVSVGLVTWNSAAKLPTTLEALAQQRFPNLELLVVDNASKDDSVAYVQARFPQSSIIRNGENRGYCGGHNQAIQATRGAYYLALNPDAVLRPDYISTLVEALEIHPECGSAAGKLLQSDVNSDAPVIDSTGLFIDRKRRQYLRGHSEVDLGLYDQPGEVFGVDGAAPLYRRTMLAQIKFGDQYFDESFFANKEDVDLAWRAQIAGWRCWYTPAAVALHPRSFRPGRRTSISGIVRLHAVKNRYLLLIRNESRAGWRRDGLRIAWYDLQIAAYMSMFERDSLAAFGLVRQLWPRAMEWRRHIWRSARTAPDDLLRWFV